MSETKEPHRMGRIQTYTSYFNLLGDKEHHYKIHYKYRVCLDCGIKQIIEEKTKRNLS